MRKNFYDIVNNAEFNPQIEFDRIRYLFTITLTYPYNPYHNSKSLADIVNLYFNLLPKSIIKRTISLKDFKLNYGFDIYDNVNICIKNEDLIKYCEYIKTLLLALVNLNITGYNTVNLNNGEFQFIDTLLKTIDSAMNDLGLMPMQKGDFQLFIPKDAAVVSASEIVPEEIAELLLEYHHYSLKDNIDKKRTILFKLACHLEPRRKDLKSINSILEDNLFYLFNNMNIRHNNTEHYDNEKTDKKNYHQYVKNLPDKQLEEWYDETYQLCLLAILELDNVERNNKIKQLRDNISNTK